MREIKFRQALFSGKEMKFVRWHYWGFIDGEFRGVIGDPDNAQLNSYQFTGLRDKNGIEIYEGDIVAENPRIIKDIPCHGDMDTAEIVKMKIIQGSDDMGVDCTGYPLYWEDFEVIGNIYEGTNDD